MKHFSLRLLAALAFMLSLALPAQAQLVSGRDFLAIDPAQTTDNPAKIEVVEYFSYACPHCFELNPLVGPWAAKLPSDVTFKRVPVGFNSPYYQNMARVFYALEALGELSRVDGPLFSALHEKGLKLVDEKSLVEWVQSQGVDGKKFSDAYSSFGIVSKAKRADQMAQAAKITGVPAFVVDGRYQVIGKEVKSYSEMLALTGKVIEKRRAERNTKK